MVLSLLVVFGASAVAFAAQSSSPSYQVNEVFFGSGGNLHACSSDEDGDGSGYCAKQSAGELGVGKTCSDAYCAHGGFNTDRYSYLEFKVDGTSINLGTLDPGTPKTANATFSVKAYLASGYVVTTESSPPTNSSYTLAALATPTAFNASQEQFGINLVANTSPTTFGADPSQVPGSTYSFGQVASDYATANKFMYKKGDVVAYSNSSSGETDYTVSYLFNVTSVTPGGTYDMNHVLVATATY